MNEMSKPVTAVSPQTLARLVAVVGEKNAIIQADLQDGEAAGVSSTPTIFVNGRFISGIMPIDQLSTVIDDELRHAGKKAASK